MVIFYNRKLREMYAESASSIYSFHHIAYLFPNHTGCLSFFRPPPAKSV